LEKIVSVEKETITAVVCVSACGGFVLPMLSTKRKTIGLTGINTRCHHGKTHWSTMVDAGRERQALPFVRT